MTYLSKIKLGLRVFSATSRNWLFLRFKNDIKLHLGAGGTTLPDYLNVDSLFLRNTELVSKIEHLNFFVRKESVSAIYASHVLEHFSHEEVKKILQILYNLLTVGGQLRLSVPDIDKIAKIYNKNLEHFQRRGNSPWNGLIYGGQCTKYDFHKTGFNFNWLSFLLGEAGFKHIQEYDAREFTRENNIKDSSLADQPFGEMISLNIVAGK